MLHQVLAFSSRLDPVSRSSIARNLTKLCRYSAVYRFLQQAARRHSVFDRIRIVTVKLRAPNLPATELDSMTTGIIDALLVRSEPEKLISKSYGSSSQAIKDHIGQEAILHLPVHAEIQLLFHYERNSSGLSPRIICSSKKACFLCNLFFKTHGRFIVPSTHGRVYEKWALPCEAEHIGKMDKEFLATLWSFVSAVEDTLTRQIQLTVKPYPDPSESIVLYSTVCSQSSQHKSSVYSLSASQGSELFGDSVSASKKDASSRTEPSLPCAGRATTAMGSSILDLRSLWETSSATTLRAPNPSNTLPRHVLQDHLKPTSLRISLTKGQPIWCEISTHPYLLEVRTPNIHLAISRDEVLLASWDGCWLLLEYLSDRSVQSNQTISTVNLLDIPIDRDKTLDFSSGQRPAELRLSGKEDVISIICFLQKPGDGLDMRAARIIRPAGPVSQEI